MSSKDDILLAWTPLDPPGWTLLAGFLWQDPPGWTLWTPLDGPSWLDSLDLLAGPS